MRAVKPLLTRVCIVLWALWVVICGAWAIAGPFVADRISGSDIGAWLGFVAATAFLLVLLQYLLTGLWRPADLLK